MEVVKDPNRCFETLTMCRKMCTAREERDSSCDEIFFED